MVVIDPGPDVLRHIRALASEVSGAASVTVALTHGHADHAAGADALAELTDGRIVGPDGIVFGDGIVIDGDVIPTDAGNLTVVHTPGHTPEHVCYHWADHEALFVGDLLLGVGDTTWVAEYPGCVADYLDSLERVRTLGVRTLYPAHGPPLTDASDAIERFDAHRRSRIEQARAALQRRPDATIEELLDTVYGPELPSKLRPAAARSLGALVEYVRSH